MLSRVRKSIFGLTVFMTLLIPVNILGQTSTINWTDVHQIIDGFGASNIFYSAPMSTANQKFFFGTGSGELGLSVLRTAVSDDAVDGGSCATVSTACAGNVVGDMQAVIANGGRVFASSLTPPAAYTTNRSVSCAANGGGGTLATADYSLYATWLINYIKSLSSLYSINLYALSLQNEPDVCSSTESSQWTDTQLDTYIKGTLGPALAEAGVTTPLFMPENSGYNFGDSSLTGPYGGTTCMEDSSCYQYVSGVNWHDYDASYTAPDTTNRTPYPTGWHPVSHYWMSEASCINDGYLTGCEPGFNTDMTTDGLLWAALIDDRLVNENVNAYLYWWLIDQNSGDDEGLMSNTGVVPQRAYVFGQYAHFIRPGYYRIDATHIPQGGVSVSAYENTSTGTLVVVATNYRGSAISQGFALANAPTFTSVTPYITSASLSLSAQPTVTLSANAFTYTLPPESVTTFVGSSSMQPPTALTAKAH